MRLPVYLLLILFTAFFPLVLSFDSRVRFFARWRYFFISSVIPAALFLVWDYFFISMKIWGFNQQYLIGIHILNLPLEEVLFFFVIPFACIFIYECLNYYITTDWLKPFANTISVALVALLLPLAMMHIHKLYTAVCFVCAALLLIILFFVKPPYMGRIYLTYLVVLIPFLLVNGILTHLPVVWYNESHITGVRIISIPVEDTVYTLLQLLVYIIPYEWLKSFNQNKSLLHKQPHAHSAV